MHDPGNFLPSGDAAIVQRPLKNFRKSKVGLKKGLQRGALAVGMGVNYNRGGQSSGNHRDVSSGRAVSRTGACAPALRGIKEPTTGLAGLEEAIAAAAATGAPLHVVHITSMGLRDTPQLIAMVEGARSGALM